MPVARRERPGGSGVHCFLNFGERDIPKAMKERTIYFVFFFLSGFVGLIYESLWAQYLKLFLGHAAYAQALVLVIFMGGIAIGSWVCARYSSRWNNLLLGYAAAEAAIGTFAFFFHAAFDHATQWSYASVFHELGSPAAVSIFKWSLSAVLILPQTILLGMTFPLMAAGIVRRWPDMPGRSISLLYFLNSLGGAIGVLACGFFLVRFWGLPGTMRFAGIINIGIACGVWAYARSLQEASTPPQERRSAAHDHTFRLLMAVSLLTGTASFMYEIGWIRMLSLVLGSSTHSFELMLCAFILGLAVGGYWIRKRSDRSDVSGLLAFVQICMGSCAILSLLFYNSTFAIMQWMIQAFPKTDTGYVLFNLSSAGLSLVLMFPTTFFAGMTLPLITAALIRRGHGESSIGAVYAINTVGAIVGVVLAVHVGLPLLGLKGLIVAGAALDMALGAVLVWSRGITAKMHSRRVAVAAACISIVGAAMLFMNLDPYKMGSGVYRYGTLQSADDAKIVYHEDGKTATVTLFRSNDGTVNLRTNGKADAMLQTDPSQPPTPDEYTMVLLAALPLSVSSHAEKIANIGFGSGLTTATLLLDDRVKEVDTIEIEPVMVHAARNIGPMVEPAFTDLRSRIYIDDAKSFFATQNIKYDIIVSEPSNPWVSGVASLFSEEFYHLMKGRLNDAGVFCQWLHLYEINNDLTVSVLQAISKQFSHIALYISGQNDLIILATNSGGIIETHLDAFRSTKLERSLKRLGLDGISNIAFRRLGDERLYHAYLATSSIPPNSDYRPILDQYAERSRFLMERAPQLAILAYQPLPLQQLLAPVGDAWKNAEIVQAEFFTPSIAAAAAGIMRDSIVSDAAGKRRSGAPPVAAAQAVQVKQLFYGACRESTIERIGLLYQAIAIEMTPFLQPDESARLWKTLEAGRCTQSFSKTEKKWMALIKAVGQRDASAMTTAAESILEESQEIPNGPLSYVVAVGMVGNIMQGEQERSLRLWTGYRARIYGTMNPSIFFQVLVALSAEK